MKYKVIKGVKGIEKFGYYKNLKYKVNDNIKNRIEFYIADDVQKIIYKKCYKYLGILNVNDLIDMKDFDEVNDDIIRKYIDDSLGNFIEMLENVIKYYDLTKQIKSQNARCRIGWFDKGEYRYLGYLQEKKEKLSKLMKI